MFTIVYIIHDREHKSSIDIFTGIISKVAKGFSANPFNFDTMRMPAIVSTLYVLTVYTWNGGTAAATNDVE